MKEAHREAYREEVLELLALLEASLLQLEECPEDREIIGDIFRALHTIKGSGAMFGFDDIAAFTHEIETAFDLVRDGRIAVSKSLVDLTLRAGDQIRSMLEAESSGTAAEEETAREIVEALEEMIPRRNGMSHKSPAIMSPPAERSSTDVTYRIRFRPHRDILASGTNPILLLNELRELGDCSVVAHTGSIPDLHDSNPEECHTHWDVFVTTSRGLDAIRDVFIFVEDDCDLKIDVVEEEMEGSEQGDTKKLGEILMERGELSQVDLLRVLGDQKRIGQMLVENGLVDEVEVQSALVEQQHQKERLAKHRNRDLASSVRVPADRLDTLVDLVGELVTVQARLSETAASNSDPTLLAIAEEVERLTGELRDNTMSIRMVPIGSTFNRFRRLVRDLSCELGKAVSFTTEGADTELDKTVIERLNDPLVHLIRNCVDHGIEEREERLARGKSEEGTIHLAASYSGASVLIRITDDGAGMDAAAIRAKAQDKGLIAPDAECSEKELFNLIFSPGFSTANMVTSISGRGVGMDVVKRSVEQLRGSIDIDSEGGAGTTITLKLPLTLAIIDGLLVQIGEGYYVLPLSSVEECVELTHADVEKVHGRHLTYVREQIVPYIRLREFFGVSGAAPGIEQIAVAEAGGTRVGFVVDSVVGEHQTVIKNLGKVFRNVKGISGATILGDGTVALILDLPKLVQEVEMDDQSERRQEEINGGGM